MLSKIPLKLYNGNYESSNDNFGELEATSHSTGGSLSQTDSDRPDGLERWAKCMNQSEFHASSSARSSRAQEKQSKPQLKSLGPSEQHSSDLLAAFPGPKSSASSEPGKVRLAKSEPNSSLQNSSNYNNLKQQVHQQLQRIYGNAKRKGQTHQSGLNRPDRLMYCQSTSQLQQLEPQSIQKRTRSARPSESSSCVIVENSAQSSSDPFLTYDSLNSEANQKRRPSDPVQGSEKRQRSAGMDDSGNEEDDHLLSSESIASSDRTTIEQKRKQLESLQYATATAAALLRATANTAAAIATSEAQVKNINADMSSHPNRPRPFKYSTDNKRENRRPISIQKDRLARAERSRLTIYADPRYQANYAECYPGNMNYESASFQAPLANSIIVNRLNQRQFPPLNTRQEYLSANFAAPPQPRMAAQLRSLDWLPHRHINHQRLPLAMELNKQNQRNASLYQALPATPRNMPLLTPLMAGQNIRGGDLLARLLADNSLNDRGISSIPVAHQANQTARDLTIYSNILNQKDLQRTAGKIYAIPTPNSIGQNQNHFGSNDQNYIPSMPFIVDERVRKLTLVDRLCRIDLTLFWWSLLLLSLILMGILVYLTHQVF